jgi:prepilin-type N-terminal cleavage/methylation domain-containing protein/prepilin-type processing-associated H-X9-DG protein
MSMPTTGRSRGFTVTELMVAIAIVVVLAAILFPVLGNVRNNARKVECISHLHYISIAIGLYVGDHSGYLPNWCCTNPNPNVAPAANLKDQPDPSITTWDMTLADYLARPNGGAGTQPWQELVRCPANPVTASVLGPGATAETCRAYALARQTQQPDKSGNLWGGYVALIPNPAATVMIFEKGANLPGSWGDALGENVNQSHGTAADPTSGYENFAYHFGGKNILFVDGNVKWILQGTGPYLWNPTGSNGPGACERWGASPAGDWPPLS